MDAMQSNGSLDETLKEVCRRVTSQELGHGHVAMKAPLASADLHLGANWKATYVESLEQLAFAT